LALFALLLSAPLIGGLAKAIYSWGKEFYDARRYSEAFGRSLEAADQGDAKACNELGWMYQYGIGIQKDEAQAVSWYRKAANQGFAPASYKLGIAPPVKRFII
jgi:TPR repeat protein